MCVTVTRMNWSRTRHRSAPDRLEDTSSFTLDSLWPEAAACSPKTKVVKGESYSRQLVERRRRLEPSPDVETLCAGQRHRRVSLPTTAQSALLPSPKDLLLSVLNDKHDGSPPVLNGVQPPSLTTSRLSSSSRVDLVPESGQWPPDKHFPASLTLPATPAVSAGLVTTTMACGRPPETHQVPTGSRCSTTSDYHYSGRLNTTLVHSKWTLSLMRACVKPSFLRALFLCTTLLVFAVTTVNAKSTAKNHWLQSGPFISVGLGFGCSI